MNHSRFSFENKCLKNSKNDQKHPWGGNNAKSDMNLNSVRKLIWKIFFLYCRNNKKRHVVKRQHSGKTIQFPGSCRCRRVDAISLRMSCFNEQFILVFDGVIMINLFRKILILYHDTLHKYIQLFVSKKIIEEQCSIISIVTPQILSKYFNDFELD
jgi:hypothetical protein